MSICKYDALFQKSQLIEIPEFKKNISNLPRPKHGFCPILSKSPIEGVKIERNQRKVS